MSSPIDTAQVLSVALAAGDSAWVAPLSSPRDIAIPARTHGELPVTVVSTDTSNEARFIAAFNPQTVRELLDGRTPSIELWEHANAALPGRRTAVTVAPDLIEIRVDDTAVACTDFAPIAAFLCTIDRETALALLER
jgi:hypothetical protein